MAKAIIHEIKTSVGATDKFQHLEGMIEIIEAKEPETALIVRKYIAEILPMKQALEKLGVDINISLGFNVDRFN